MNSLPAGHAALPHTIESGICGESESGFLLQVSDKSSGLRFHVLFSNPRSPGRQLTAEQAWSINFILKKRAVRYIAALEEEWLAPEDRIPSHDWARLDSILRPEKVTLIKEIWADYSDGRRVAIDRLGRPITDPEAIARMEDFDRQIRKK